MTKKILVIDDEELIIKSLSKLLEKSGYEVFIAKNGQDAIVMTEESEFDLIIADIRMPGVNGVDTVCSIYEELKQNNLKRIPVIFITGYADKENEKRAKALNPIDYIYKPFDTQELLSKVKKTIG